MKSYDPGSGYAASQKTYNWQHSDGSLVSKSDVEKSISAAKMLRVFYNKRNDLLPEPNSILVVGCRAGYECTALADRFETLVVGVDIVPEFVALSSKKVPTMCCDMHDLELPDDGFDLTVCIGTLEHAWSPAIVMEELHRVTRHEGIVYITVDLEKDRGYSKSHYSFSDDPEEWLTLYREAGFEVIKHWVEPTTHDTGLYALLGVT